MGLAWFLVYWKWRALRAGDERCGRRTILGQDLRPHLCRRCRHRHPDGVSVRDRLDNEHAAAIDRVTAGCCMNALVTRMKYAVARRRGGHIRPRVSRAHGRVVLRLLPCALDGALVVRAAWDLDRGRRSHQRFGLAIGLGLCVCRLECPACDPVWNRARECDQGSPD